MPAMRISPKSLITFRNLMSRFPRVMAEGRRYEHDFGKLSFSDAILFLAKEYLVLIGSGMDTKEFNKFCAQYGLEDK